MILGILVDFLGSRGARAVAKWEAHSDSALIKRYRDTGNMDLISVLMHRYTSLIVARTLNYLKEEEATRDFIQDLFLKLSDKLTRDGQIDNFKGWLRTLITHTLIDQSRRRQLYTNYIATLSEPTEEIHNGIALEMDAELLSKALEELKPLPRLYILQHFFRGKQNKEIAEEFSLEMNQVRGARNRGLKKLSELLGATFDRYFQNE